ncbi:mRNA-capping enzyme subunit beta [Linnemannia zychae]|nr:mRNA-capping enzyme subunit beta [Linnemannia zychae]
MSDQGATKKRPLEEDSQDTAIGALPNKSSNATMLDGEKKQDGPTTKKPRSEESSSVPPGSEAVASGVPPPEQQQRKRSSKLVSFFGTNFPDDVVKVVADFLFEHCHHRNVEIEAKIGILMDRNTGRRIEFPVKNEVVLMPQARTGWYTFSSDMTVAQHAHFNTCLNKVHEMSQQSESKVEYKHTYEIDQFYTSQGNKTRVTLDQKTRKILPNGIIKKERIADLDIFSPRRPFDYRISVNVEEPAPAPSGNPQRERQKNRVSYRLNNLKIDLTQVKSNNMPNNPQQNQQHNYSQMRSPMGHQQSALDLTHELEIEFVHPEELVREREIRINSHGSQPDRFLEITANFINNVRGLIAQGYNIPQPNMQRPGQHPMPMGQYPGQGQNPMRQHPGQIQQQRR